MAASPPEGLTGWGKAVSTVQNKASATKMFDRFAATVPDTPVSGTTLAAITLEQAVDERTWTCLADFVTKQRKNAKRRAVREHDDEELRARRHALGAEEVREGDLGEGVLHVYVDEQQGRIAVVAQGAHADRPRLGGTQSSNWRDGG